MTPKLVFDVHLDLSYNALDFNRDQRWTQERIRRRELGMTDYVFRTRNTVCFPEMRRGRVGLCVATQLSRYVDYFRRLPGWASPEQAWAMTHGQLAWYREMESCGELVQIRNRAQLDAHLERHPGELDLQAPIASFEMAARMQTLAKDVMDLSRETKATRALFGLDEDTTRKYGEHYSDILMDFHVLSCFMRRLR